MDEQERKAAFQQAYDELVGQFGMAYSINAHASKHGSSWLVEQVIDIVPVIGWTEPDPVPDPLAELQKEVEALREQLAAAEAKGREAHESPDGRPILTDEEAQRALHPGDGA